MPTGALPDPLYHLARQHLLFSGDTRISSLQRWLRIGYEHARALREALRGDALDYHADTDTWHIHPNAPDGQVKFPHPWPPQIPPGRTAGL